MVEISSIITGRMTLESLLVDLKLRRKEDRICPQLGWAHTKEDKLDREILRGEGQKFWDRRNNDTMVPMSDTESSVKVSQKA